MSLDDIDACRRLIVVGCDADLAAVLTRLLRADRLDVEVAHATSARTARRAISGRRTAGSADPRRNRAPSSSAPRNGRGSPLRGEAVVDDTVLFDGDVPGVRIEPTLTMPGLRAAVVSGRGRPRRWVAGRAAQLGTTGALVIRDGVPSPRPVRRSTFYRHTEGWLLVR